MIFALQISQENKAENVLDDDVECCGPAREEKRSERVSCDRDTKAEAIGLWRVIQITSQERKICSLSWLCRSLSAQKKLNKKIQNKNKTKQGKQNGKVYTTSKLNIASPFQLVIEQSNSFIQARETLTRK